MKFLLFFLLALVSPVWAKRSLLASSLVTCMQNSQISPSYFDVTFDPDSRALEYNIDLTTTIAANVTAHVQIYAYGFLVIDKTIDVCSLGWKQFCPMYPGSMQVNSIEYISESYVKEIPGIAYSVPDIDAVVKLDVYDKSTGTKLSCIQSSFTNGKTVSQVGVKWATAVIAGLGLLIAAVMSTFGNSNAASHISTNAMSLFLYFQSVVVVSMQNVDRVPPIASAWAENLAWSMGLIKVTFMQKIFRWYVQSTGGSPTTYFLGSAEQILVQRSQLFLRNLHDYAKNGNAILPGIKRSLDYSLSSNVNLIVLRGIKRIGYNTHIEPTSIVATGFTFFVLCGFLLLVIIYFVKLIAVLLIRLKQMNPNKLSHFRKSFSSIARGSLLRYIYIGFTQIVILSLWEFTRNDSPALIVLSVIALLSTLIVLSYSFWMTYRFATLSTQKYSNPAALLYGDARTLHKYGFCYTMFAADKYWFGMVFIAYSFVKAVFIGLCQKSPKTSTIVLFVLDFAYMVYMFIHRPFLNKPTNIVGYCMAIVTTINSFLFIFFSDVFGQPAQVGSIMGWVFFILNAAFSMILLISIIVLITMAVLSKNPDARFEPARDDRTSFQRQSSVKRKVGSGGAAGTDAQNELSALGAAAQAHQSDWEGEIHRLKDLGAASASSDALLDLTENSEKAASVAIAEHSAEDSTVPTIGEKIKSKIGRSFSHKSKASPEDSRHITRISDTLDDDEDVLTNLQDTSELHTHRRQESVQSESAYSGVSNTNPTRYTGIV